MSVSPPSCLAVLWGQALGDAVGELAGLCPRWPALDQRVCRTPRLRWTDDTAMTWVLARHLAQHREVDAEALGAAFAAAHDAEPWRGYGPGPVRVFTEGRRLGSYLEAARRLHAGQGSWGNGAAMRAAPLGLVFAEDLKVLDENARAQAAVTHAHPVAQDAAAIQARAVAEALRGRDEPLSWRRFLRRLDRHATTTEMRSALEGVARAMEDGLGGREAARLLGTAVAAHRSLPFALWCFLRHPDDWLACFRCAALQGGDRDTLAAMAGAVCAARVGLGGLPKHWLTRLEARDALGETARRLCRNLP